MKIQIVIPLVVLGASGCSQSAKPTRKLTYSATARSNYFKGVKALKKKNFEEAQKYFKYVRNRHPLSKYAPLSELRQADVLYKQGKYLSAIDAYQTFIKEHPSHVEVGNGYVPYMIGYCHWRMTPGDFWLFPPSYEKDLTPALAAMKVFRRFLERFPDSKYARKARRFYKRALRKLANRELYVARFYLSRGKPRGAILRLEYLVKKYPDAGYEPTVLFLLGKTFLRMKRIQKAVETFKKIIKRYPKDHNAKRARLYLMYIKRQYAFH